MRTFAGAVADDGRARLLGVARRMTSEAEVSGGAVPSTPPSVKLAVDEVASGLAVLRTARSCEVAIGLDGVVALVAARLDERASLAARLGVDAALGDAELLLAGYRRWSAALPGEVVGDFALVLWDPAERRLLCAVDPQGIGLLFTAELPTGGVAFASHPTPLRHLLGDELRLDTEILARYLCRLPTEPSRTSFVGLRRVAPGTTVAFQLRDGSPRRTVQRYWDLSSFPRLQLRSPEEYLEAYRSALERAVTRRIGGEGIVAIAQSGGLDSASILGLAARGGAGPRLRPIYVAPLEASCDESELVTQLEGHVGVPVLERRPAADLETLRRVGEAVGEPRYLDHFPIAWSVLEGARAAGATRLLTGLYGDLVSGSVPASAWLPSLLRAHAWATWWAELPRTSHWRMLRTALGSIRSLPTSEPLLRHRGGRLRSRWFGEVSCLSPSARRELGIDVAEEEFLIHVARGHRDVADYRARWLAASAPEETELLGRAAAVMGIEAAHPFGDRDLMAVSLSLPLALLRKNGLGRHPLRVAVTGTVPEGLRTWQRKILFTDFYRGMFARLIPELARLPLAEPLRPLLSSHRLEALVRKGSWSYPEGAHLWRCLAVNAWLWKHSPKEPPRPPR